MLDDARAVAVVETEPGAADPVGAQLPKVLVDGDGEAPPAVIVDAEKADQGPQNAFDRMFCFGGAKPLPATTGGSVSLSWALSQVGLS